MFLFAIIMYRYIVQTKKIWLEKRSDRTKPDIFLIEK